VSRIGPSFEPQTSDIAWRSCALAVAMNLATASRGLDPPGCPGVGLPTATLRRQDAAATSNNTMANFFTKYGASARGDAANLTGWVVEMPATHRSSTAMRA
jgi:hypothetical protein